MTWWEMLIHLTAETGAVLTEPTATLYAAIVWASVPVVCFSIVTVWFLMLSTPAPKSGGKIAMPNQDPLLGMPGPPPAEPPPLKNMAKLMTTIDQLYPADTYTAVGQWERFIEVSATVFGNGVQFIIPLVDYHDTPAPTDEEAK